jgi:hypothetical protein
LEKKLLWTNFFAPRIFFPFFRQTLAEYLRSTPDFFRIFSRNVKTSGTRFREHDPPSKNAKKSQHNG